MELLELTIKQIAEKIQKRSKSSDISLAVKQQTRLKFHCEKNLTDSHTSARTDFFSMVKNILPESKYKTFQSLFRYPIKTNEVTDIIFKRLARIFSGSNPVYEYQFTSTDAKDDWEYYRTSVLNEPYVWASKGWEYFKTNINSVLVCDMSQEPNTGKYPAPYFYFVKIDNVIDYEVGEDNVMKYIIFKQGDNFISIDQASYKVFSSKNNTISDLIIDNRHDLGYCPARFFWTDSISLDKIGLKEHPLTDQLDNLDWYLFYSVSKKHLDLYGSYPIYVGYEARCDFNDDVNVCSGGVLKNKSTGTYSYDSSGAVAKCPKCSSHSLAGAGTFITKPIPIGNQPPLNDPMQIITIDTESLQHNINEEERLRDNIINSTVGVSSEMLTNKAINEKQVGATFEDQLTILFDIKRNFELAMEFVDRTICLLRYGKDLFVDCNIDLGTDFYIQSTDSLMTKYKLAIESGATESELDAIKIKIIESEYRNNPFQLQRLSTLLDLEPFRHKTIEEVKQLYDAHLITIDELLLKLNFANFIARFERENINIVEYASALPYKYKINNILKILNEYVREVKGELQGS